MNFGITVLAIIVISSVIDIRIKQIPLLLIGAMAFVSILRLFCDFKGGSLQLEDIVISLLPGALFLLISLLTREGVGYGDGLVLIAAGPALGGTVAVFGAIAALFANGIFSGILLAIRKAGKKTKIPFVPFLAAGMGVMLFAKG